MKAGLCQCSGFVKYEIVRSSEAVDGRSPTCEDYAVLTQGIYNQLRSEIAGFAALVEWVP